MSALKSKMLIFLAPLLSSCTLIGAGIGSQYDEPDIAHRVPLDRVPSLAYAEHIRVHYDSGDEIEGSYLGYYGHPYYTLAIGVENERYGIPLSDISEVYVLRVGHTRGTSTGAEIGYRTDLAVLHLLLCLGR